MPGTGGTTGTGGSIGTGGASGTGGSLGTGGRPRTGGTPGTGGSPGTGGTSAPTCIPACASGFACCDGSDQRCDGTRLPTGDGTNPGQFVVSGDGLTVTDTITGLMWQRDGSGTRQATGCDGTRCTWGGAKNYCAGLNLGGLSGWRLPAVMELRTIVDFTVTSGARIDATAFPGTPADRFWTSSPYAGSSGYAWYVNFNYGYSYDVDVVGHYNRVRCVR